MWMRILGALVLLAVILVAILVWMSRPLGDSTLEARYLTDEDRYVEAAEMRWRVRESGPDDAPALVLIHGFSHSLEAFEPWADRLDDAYRIIRFDLPGHGLTDAPPDNAYSNEATAEQIAVLLEEIAPERFVIGGNSLGGLAAWRYAAAHPDRVSGLVLVSPGGYSINGVTEVPVAVPPPVAMLLRTAPRPGVHAMTEQLYADPDRLDDADVERIRAMMRGEGTGKALVARLEQFTLPDPEPVLREIETPTLILWGARDAMVPVEHGSRFEAAMPNAELVVLDDAGHVAMEEKPDVTAARVRAFLETVSAEP